MNYETIIIIILSYSLGVFSVWIKQRCENKEEGCEIPTLSPVEKNGEKSK